MAKINRKKIPCVKCGKQTEHATQCSCGKWNYDFDLDGDDYPEFGYSSPGGF